MIPLNRSMSLTKEQSKGRWWGAIFWSLGLFAAANLLVTILFVVIMLLQFSSDDSSGGLAINSVNLADLFPGAGLLLNFGVFPLLLGLLLLVSRKTLKRSLASLGFFKENRLKKYGIGLGIGGLEITLVTVICLLLGSLKIRTVPQVDWGMIVILLLAFAVQGLTEEVLCRGVLMNAIAAEKGVWAGIIGNSLIFTALHGANPNITVLPLVNLFIFGLMFSLLFYLTDNIWLAGAAHSIWNFVLGPVLGIEVSGMDFGAAILQTELLPNKALINGGTFGLEGGLVCTVVGLLFCGVLYYVITQKRPSNTLNVTGD